MAGLGKVRSYAGKRQLEALLLSQNLFKGTVGLLIFQSLVRQPLLTAWSYYPLFYNTTYNRGIIPYSMKYCIIKKELLNPLYCRTETKCKKKAQEIFRFFLNLRQRLSPVDTTSFYYMTDFQPHGAV